MDTNATGRFIAERRKQKGYTQKELAEKLMVTDKAISRWETGKGLPDTSLLKPLGDILDVSVSELLSGRIIEEADMKDQTDKIILESLNYSKRMLVSTISVILLIIGISLIISPLFLASQSYIWILGLAIVAITILYIYTRKRGDSMKVTNKAYYLTAIALQGIALILARHTNLYVFDEPLAGAYIISRDEIFKIIREYCSHGATIIATHLISSVEHIINCALFLNKECMAYGTKEELLYGFDNLENSFRYYATGSNIKP